MYSFLLPYNPNNENLLEKIFFNINWNELTNEKIDLCNNELNLVDTLISNVYINKSLHKCLNNAKQQINDNEAKWDNIKKYTNSYEFIHTSVPGLKNSISQMKPLSRAF